MNKDALIRQISTQMAQELQTLLQASDQAHQTATHSESKAENKYDTRGLEAAYLAHGLSVRAQALREAQALFVQWQPKAFARDEPIGVGALVTLEDDAGQQKRVLLAAQGGGLKGRVAAGEVTVVTPSAPLGKALLGRELDDRVALTIQGRVTAYWVVDLE